MIMRVWHGYTKPEDADLYDRLLRDEILPGIHRIEGYGGAWLLRRRSGDEEEFVTITIWDSWEGVQRFAGGDGTSSVIHPKAEELLTRHEEHSVHYAATWIP